MSTTQRDPFVHAFYGHFRGLLQWEDMDRLWDRLRDRAEDSWYGYTVGEAPPRAPASAETLRAFLQHTAALLRDGHREDYCGIVYVDDPIEPTFVKVFDPANLGVVCGYSEQPPLPAWVLSLQPPVDLVTARSRERPPRRGWRRWLTPPAR